MLFEPKIHTKTVALNGKGTIIRCMKRYHRLLYAFVVVTIVFATIYAVMQQQNRQQANDMPTMIATEAAAQLNNGLSLTGLAVGKVDVRTSLMPFLTVYDKQGKVVAGSGWLLGKVAQLPTGVVQHATLGKNHYVTWSPATGLRFATATVATEKYYVVGAQSLKSTEHRIDQLGWLVLYGYIIALAAVVWAYVFSKPACGCGCCGADSVCTPPADKPKKHPKS